MSLSRTQIRKIIREELKQVHKVQHPVLRNSKCTVYLKESNGALKPVSFNSVLKQQKKGVFSEQQVHDILESSFQYDMKMFNRYSAAYTNLSQHMISEGLITENGKITKKGRLLEKKERGVVLVESDMRKYAASLILEQEEEGEEEIDTQSIKTTGQKVAGAVGKGLKAVGGVLAAPFRAWKWFKDKIWGAIKGALIKVGQAIEAFGNKYNIGLIQQITEWVKAAFGAVAKFCGKNKWLKILCGVVASVCIALLVKAVIATVLAQCGISMTSMVMSYAGGCVAGAAGLAEGNSDEKPVLGEAISALCKGAAEAGSHATERSLNAIKGALKMMAAKGEIADAADLDAALNFVDKYEEVLDAKQAAATDAAEVLGKVTGPEWANPQLGTILEDFMDVAGDCNSEGSGIAKVAVGRAIDITDGKFGSAAPQITQELIALGEEGGNIKESDTWQALGRILKSQGMSAEDAQAAAESLGDKLGYDTDPTWSKAAQEAAAAAADTEGLSPFQAWMREIGGMMNLLGPSGFEETQGGLTEFVKAAKAFKNAETGEVGIMAWKAAGQPALEGAALQESLNRMKQLAGVL